MKSSKRLSQTPFPPYSHLPGKTVHPNKPGGHQYEAGEIQTTDLLNPNKALDHDIYCYGIDLLNHGYFWESHVAFEAIWHVQGRKGDEANLLKALIKIGAAGLKQRLGQEEAAEGHLSRAFELIEDLRAKNKFYCGLDLDELLQLTPESIEIKPSS